MGQSLTLPLQALCVLMSGGGFHLAVKDEG